MTFGAWDHVAHFTQLNKRADPEHQFGFWSDQNLMHHGLTLAADRQIDEAISAFADGAARYVAVGGRSGLATFHAAFAEVLARQGRLDEAAQYAVEARTWLDNDGELWNHTAVMIAEALVAAGQGRTADAEAILVRAAEVADEQEAFALAERARRVAAELEVAAA
jgi:hypothetical protein